MDSASNTDASEGVKAQGSLINLIRARPDAFSDIGFVFVAGNGDPDVLDAINQQELDEGGQTEPRWTLGDS